MRRNPTKKEWQTVRSLASEVAVACGGEKRRYIERLAVIRSVLADLRRRYKNSPCVLATLADYSQSRRESLRLLKQAYFIAVQSRDAKNRTMIASSIAQIYSEEIYAPRQATFWLGELEKNLSVHWDDDENNELLRLRKRRKVLARSGRHGPSVSRNRQMK
jgi:hypothetical protein